MIDFFSRGKCPGVWLVACLVIVWSAEPAERVDFPDLTKKLLAMISDKATNDMDLQEAIGRLGGPSEPPAFWNQIAKDETYSPQHRRRCIVALLRRHRGDAGTVAELAKLVDQPNWVKDTDISKVELVVGRIPIDFTPNDSIFKIQILPNASGQETDIYFRVAGKMTREEFSNSFRGDGQSPVIGGRPIIEVGFSER